VAVSREDTQAQLVKLSAGTLQHVPSQTYTLADRFEERAAGDPDRVFIAFEDRRISYGEFNRRANRVANAAHRLGLRRGDVAALLMENRPEFIEIWAGLAKLGVTIALVNPNTRDRALQHALEASGAKVVIVGAARMASPNCQVRSSRPFAGAVAWSAPSSPTLSAGALA